MNVLEENELILEAQKDPNAFGRLFDEYYPKIFKYVLRRTGDTQVAQDITADVFFKALKKLWQFKWRSIPFSAWLYRIATNEVNYYFRKGIKRKTVSLDALLGESAFEVLDPSDLMEELHQAERDIERHKEYSLIQKRIAELPVHYQEVIALRYFESKKLTEIAVILGKKDGTIKSLHSRALGLLRTAMENRAMQPSATASIVSSEGRNILTANGSLSAYEKQRTH